MQTLHRPQTVVITGASSGIGESLVKEFHQLGYRVVGLARRADRLESLMHSLNQVRPDSALAIPCDVNQPESVRSALLMVKQKFGTLDGMIANAGFGVAGKVEELQLSDFRRQFETNVFAVIDGFHAVKDELIKNQGFFCVVGSVNSYLSIPTASAYAMSKFAIRAFTEALYWEMKPKGVSVTLVCPGFVKTEIRKVNNLGDYREHSKEPVPEWLMMSSLKAAAKISRACIRRKKEIVITGHGWWLVKISRWVPWILNPMMKRIVLVSREKWNQKAQGRSS